MNIKSLFDAWVRGPVTLSKLICLLLLEIRWKQRSDRKDNSIDIVRGLNRDTADVCMLNCRINAYTGKAEFHCSRD
jgi:hypothetical protein